MPEATVSHSSLFFSEIEKRLDALFSPRGENAGDRIDEFLEGKPLSVFIPARFGGRGQRVDECLSLLEACSYRSLPLSLVAGINGALFLQPLSKYGDDALQERVFRDFLEQRALGGLMITEPGFGSDALSMRTRFEPSEGGYRIRGTKHWAGLTGRADYWLLTARGATPAGELERNISFFLWDRDSGGIEVEEYFPSLGLEMIPYGRNRIDTELPASHRLSGGKSGVRMLLDLLHRSRLQFPGMAMGFLRRLLDEADAHVRSRLVGGRPLIEYDQVRDRMAELQAAWTACSAMCVYSSAHASVERDCSGDALPANSIKSVVTDLMQSAAQSLLQLTGARGYRRDHIAGSAVVDSRPFQIFEGSNDILYEQIAEHVIKGMGRARERTVGAYLKTLDLTSRAAERFRSLLGLAPSPGLAQRKLVDLGRIVGRVVSMEMVIELGSRGFAKELIENSLAVFGRDIAALAGSFGDAFTASPAADYDAAAGWRGYLSAT